jgi:hypothetical protein
MNLPSVKLDNNSYHEYLEGKEVLCPASAVATRHLAEGEHVLVYKDTVASGTNISPPKSEMQSEYIGIEGRVTNTNVTHGNERGIAIVKI